MFLLLILVTTSVACNLTLLAAIAAGRSSSALGRRLFLFLECVSMAFVVAGIVGAALAAADAFGWQLEHRDIRAGLVGALALGLVAALGALLTYLEYSAAGRRTSFGQDLHSSLWIGKYGTQRWNGDEPAR